MSPITKRFEFDTTEDIFWFVGLFIGSLMTCFATFTFTLVIQHLHCIPQDQKSNKKIHIEPKNTKVYSSFSVTLSLICVWLIFTTYPVCTQWKCEYNTLGNFYYNFILDSYIFSKLFLYFLFVGRLFNPHYKKIYQYPCYIQYFLFIVMSIIFIATIISNIGAFFNFHQQTIDKMIIIWVACYVLADFVLSGITLMLFFIPLCKTSESYPGAIMESPSMSIVLKYGIISSFQTITATLYGVSLIVRFIFGWFHSTNSESNSYLDVCSLIQILDMLMTMICIYLGFAKKQTYQEYCEICEKYWITCCCNCCTGYQLVIYHDVYRNREILKQQFITNADTTINSTMATSSTDDSSIFYSTD
eukprot:186941_1